MLYVLHRVPLITLWLGWHGLPLEWLSVVIFSLPLLVLFVSFRGIIHVITLRGRKTFADLPALAAASTLALPLSARINCRGAFCQLGNLRFWLTCQNHKFDAIGVSADVYNLPTYKTSQSIGTLMISTPKLDNSISSREAILDTPLWRKHHLSPGNVEPI